MSKPEREPGTQPDTLGWRNLVDWKRASRRNKLAYLADELRISKASVSAWYNRDARPRLDLRPLVCAIVGGKPDDWLSEQEKETRRTLRQKLSRLTRRTTKLS